MKNTYNELRKTSLEMLDKIDKVLAVPNHGVFDIDDYLYHPTQMVVEMSTLVAQMEDGRYMYERTEDGRYTYERYWSDKEIEDYVHNAVEDMAKRRMNVGSDVRVWCWVCDLWLIDDPNDPPNGLDCCSVCYEDIMVTGDDEKLKENIDINHNVYTERTVFIDGCYRTDHLAGQGTMIGWK